MKLIKRSEVQLRQGGARLDYDKLSKAVESQKLDKDHVLAVSNDEMEKILGTEKRDRKTKASLARNIKKKIGFNCVYDPDEDRYVFSLA